MSDRHAGDEGNDATDRTDADATARAENGGADAPDRTGARGVSRREFVATAVAIGGSAALAACQERESPTPTATGGGAEFPTGPGPDALPAGQHRWNEYLVRDVHGNTVLPQHQLVLGLEYVGSVPPTDAEREQVADAMATLERAFQWGTGGDEGATINEGLLTLFGYAPRYFDRLGSDAGPGMQPPDEVLDAVGEDPTKTDGFDAFLILNSDFGSVVMTAEEALRGERDTVNGEPVTATFDGVFEVIERRTGVTGKGNVAPEMPDEDRPEAMPENAPLSMGFRSGFSDNQAPEGRVTLSDGPFAGGTTMQASRLEIDLDRWYEQSVPERVHEMFSPGHDADETGPTGVPLGSSSRITQDDVDRIPEDAAQNDRIGHTQKVATARDENFAPRILRRTEGVATDVPHPGVGFNFHSVQADMQAFVDARAAMNPDEYDVDVPDENHGIFDFLETRARGTFVVPPRDRRALPNP